MALMTTLRRLGLVLLNLVVASPFFYYVDGASTTKERVYPLRIIAMGAASQYVELNEKETGRVRNLTVSEHLVTAMLTPAVMLRVGNDTSKQGQNATYMAVNAIPLIACGAPAPMCKPSKSSPCLCCRESNSGRSLALPRYEVSCLGLS